MYKRKIYILTGVILLLSTVLAIFIFLYINKEEDQSDLLVEEKSDAIMLMIEFEGVEGLVNFVNDIKTRDIPGVLIASPDFVEQHCETITYLIEYHDIEIAGLDPSQPLWDVPYEEQYEIVKSTKERIYECTGKNIRVFGSKYFAYDENTVKAAEENDIEYVFARGTTGALSTIYKPEEYDVKIFSVSNVDSENWGTGSLCDYSYWAREGTPEDFEKELFGSLKYEKISPVSHTYIGGLKKSWNDVYIKFFDESNLEWLNLDSFGKIDSTLPFSEIPINREVKYDIPHPAISLEEEQNIQNPCTVLDIIEKVDSSNTELEADIVVFHNGSGSMCIELLAYLKSSDYEYVEYINTESDFNTKFSSYKSNFDNSEGVSESFEYFPIIFVKDRVFSGFDNLVKTEIEEIMEE